MQTSERDGELIEIKLGQDIIDTHSPYNSLIKLYLNFHRAVKPLFFPFYCSLLQFEQLHCEREAQPAGFRAGPEPSTSMSLKRQVDIQIESRILSKVFTGA